jgi:hypothetical protein
VIIVATDRQMKEGRTISKPLTSLPKHRTGGLRLPWDTDTAVPA